MVIHAALCAPSCSTEFEEDGIVTVWGGQSKTRYLLSARRLVS